MKESLPILYSFKRCPYAIRARMTLAYAGIRTSHREVSLRNKPAALLEASPKGTVPVLVLQDGGVLEESLDIMGWALSKQDPKGWLARQDKKLIDDADNDFKPNLDRYKYQNRYPNLPKEQDADYFYARCKTFLAKLEALLAQHHFLSGDDVGFTDIAVYPFVRQFANVERSRFEALPYPKLIEWLREFEASTLFTQVMIVPNSEE